MEAVLGSCQVKPGYEVTDACKLYNEGRCHYQPCKFRDVCRETTQQRQSHSIMLTGSHVAKLQYKRQRLWFPIQGVNGQWVMTKESSMIAVHIHVFDYY